MRQITELLQQTAAELLQSGQVDFVLGYAKGGESCQSVPYIASTKEEAGSLIFDEYCEKALSKYLLQDAFQKKKVALVLKGCDYRAVKLMLGENRISREQVYLIGVECSGMIRNGELSPFCLSCQQPTPLDGEVDVLLKGAEDTKQCGVQTKQASFPKINEIEKMSEAERFEYWKQQLNRCKRCYSCRNACPVCTCRVCIFDRENPDYIDAAKDQLAQHQFYHVIRAFHVSDRCVGCGECSRVCPEGIPLHLLHQKLQKELDNFYGAYEAGIDTLPTPLSKANASEPDFFGKGGK